MLLYLQDPKKLDKSWLKNVAMTIVYKNNHAFFYVFLFKVSKVTSKRNKKALLITNLRNVQLTI